MIEVQDLRKTFGEIAAVGGVSFRAEAGQIFGLLGPNGAGKSTIISCLCGLLAPSAGRVSIAGLDVQREGVQARRSLGLVPQELALYEDLTALQNLEYWGAAYGLRGRELSERTMQVLEEVGLSDRTKDKVKGFSGGMKRRLNFACGIVHRPRALLLDEPTVGVDPQSRVRLLDLIRGQAEGGTCVLYTTHYMEEAQELCDRIAIIDHGKGIAEGTLPELRGLMGERDLLRFQGVFDPDPVRAALQEVGEVEIDALENDALRLSVTEASRRLPAVFEALSRAGAVIRETTLSQPSLESLFIKLTGRELRE